jgi:hypothetical protein
MRPKLRLCLEGQPGDRKVEADPDTEIDAKTVEDLRARRGAMPAHGSAKRVLYRSELTFVGEDRFSYRVMDYLGRRKVHTIKIMVRPREPRLISALGSGHHASEAPCCPSRVGKERRESRTAATSRPARYSPLLTLPAASRGMREAGLHASALTKRHYFK